MSLFQGVKELFSGKEKVSLLETLPPVSVSFNTVLLPPLPPSLLSLTSLNDLGHHVEVLLALLQFRGSDPDESVGRDVLPGLVQYLVWEPDTNKEEKRRRMGVMGGPHNYSDPVRTMRKRFGRCIHLEWREPKNTETCGKLRKRDFRRIGGNFRRSLDQPQV